MKSILDLESWSQIDQIQLDQLCDHMKENNVDIVLREEESDGRSSSVYELYQTKTNETITLVEN